MVKVVRLLCTKFGVAFRDLKFAFREYRDSRGKAIAPCVRVLLNCVNTIPVSTAECERGFSKMNVVCSSLRTRLTVPHMSSLIFVSLCCPPVHLWEPLKLVKSWVALNRRAADCTQGLNVSLPLQQQVLPWKLCGMLCKVTAPIGGALSVSFSRLLLESVLLIYFLCGSAETCM